MLQAQRLCLPVTAHDNGELTAKLWPFFVGKMMQRLIKLMVDLGDVAKHVHFHRSCSTVSRNWRWNPENSPRLEDHKPQWPNVSGKSSDFCFRSSQFSQKKHHNPPIPHPTSNFPHGTFKFSATNSRFNGSSLAANPATVGFPLSASPAKRKAAGEFWMATVARVGLDLGQIWKIFYNIGKLMGFNFDDVNVCLMVFCEFLWKFHGFSQILLGFHRLTLIRV